MQDENNNRALDNGTLPEKKGKHDADDISIEKDEPVESRIAKELFPDKEEKIKNQPVKKKENLVFDIAVLVVIIILIVLLYYRLPLVFFGE